MFEFIRGRLEERGPAHAVLDAGGVGYRLEIPASTFDRIRDLPPQSETRLLVHHVVREDEWRLYGFATEAERRLFTHLLGVKGVGPAIALHILSGSTIPEIVRAIKDGDARFLDRVKGVGKKTAERVVLELREKADQVLSSLAAARPPSSGAPTSASAHGEDAARALRALGFTEPVARRAVDQALAAIGAAPGGAAPPTLERVIKEALRHAS